MARGEKKRAECNMFSSPLSVPSPPVRLGAGVGGSSGGARAGGGRRSGGGPGGRSTAAAAAPAPPPPPPAAPSPSPLAPGRCLWGEYWEDGGWKPRQGCRRLVSSRLANLQRLLWSNVQCVTLSSKKAKERPCVAKKGRRKTAHLPGKETPRLGHLLEEDHGGRGSRPGGPGGKSISKK